MTRTARLTFYLLLFTFYLSALAAAPPVVETPEELIRRANDAFRIGEKDTADKLYAAAEERTADPGLVAFNRGAILFDRKQYREAEIHFDRAIRDAACPPERAAKAWYNRGTCLLNRGGHIEVYRTAIACFENSLESAAADNDLKDRTRHNLELAKLRWSEELAKQENKKKSPNTNIPPEEENPPRPQPEQLGGPDPGPDPGGSNPKDVGTQPQAANGNTKPMETPNTVAGNNATLEVLKDDDMVQSLSEKDARANLAETAKCIKREQHALLETLYGPDRPTASHW